MSGFLLALVITATSTPTTDEIRQLHNDAARCIERASQLKRDNAELESRLRLASPAAAGAPSNDGAYAASTVEASTDWWPVLAALAMGLSVGVIAGVAAASP